MKRGFWGVPGGGLVEVVGPFTEIVGDGLDLVFAFGHWEDLGDGFAVVAEEPHSLVGGQLPPGFQGFPCSEDRLFDALEGA